MSQRIVTPWLNTNIPGAYVNSTVISNPSGLASSGVVLIMGEAAGGPDYSITNLANNFFGPTALNQVTSIYTSGPIVDAFRALSAPSNDPDISGTASSIYIIKTNKGKQASSSLDGTFTFTVTSANATVGAVYGNNTQTFTVLETISSGTTLIMAGTGNPLTSGTLTKISGTGDATITFSAFTGSIYGELTALNWGVGGNLFNYTVTSIDTEVTPSVAGTTISSYAGLSGAAFTVRVNGGPATVVTPMGTITNVATLVTSLNNAFIAASVDMCATAGLAANTIVLNYSSTPGSATPVGDPMSYSQGWGKSFELIDSTPGDLAALGLVPGLTVSSVEPGVEVQVVNSSAGINEVLNVNPGVALTVGYEGTTAVMSIGLVSGIPTLTTTVTGGTGSNLSIPLSQYTTVAQLAGYINAQPGYSCSSLPSATQLPTSALDYVSSIGICSTADVQPGRVKDSAYTFQTVLGTSTAVSFTPTATAGLPDPSPLTYLSGGLLGPTLAADIVNCIAQMAGIQVNIIVPLFSQNATTDILAGNTDPASTYTINAINELLKSHCLEYSTPTLKRNRTAICSYNDTYVNCKAQAQTLASYRVSLTCQQITQVNSAGVNTLFLPWYGACVAAGMQAGGFYKSICNHLANVVSFQDPSGYNSGDPDDVSDALSAGLLVLSQNTSGIPWVSDQTTYGLDTNFVYNSIQAVYLSDILALDLAQYFQSAIVGKSVADVSASSALGLLQQRFDYYRKLKITTTSNEAPLGYKNASITISAPSMYVNVEAKLTTSIYFVAIDLALSSVQQSAS